jgi:hypothetical protein
MKTNKIGAAIVLGGLTAGTLDFMAAMGIYHLSAQTVGKSIACGWFGNGAPGTIRTSDPQIRSLMLYPAELRARTGLSARAAI